jgi:hypothetical protein
VLTVSSEYYEEIPDFDLLRTVSPDVEVIYTKAFKTIKPRVIGDIGLRAFPFLYQAAKSIISERRIDFIWIPIPSFYISLLGRLLYEKTAVPYGIDYIDPWVRDISNRQDWRSKISLLAAKLLEPVAVRKASLISGVSEAYYQPVLERNFKGKDIAHVAMPYGFDPKDHTIVLKNLIFPWSDIKDCEPLVYAGAFLPNSHLFIKILFKVVAQKVAFGEWDMKKHFYFLGTGFYTGTTIEEYANQYGIQSLVHEIRDRFPYLHILHFLSSAYAVMAIGSTEKHYTASKIFQALLSKRSVLGIFHQDSSAVSILENCNADNFIIKYNPDSTIEEFEKLVSIKLGILTSHTWKPNFCKLNLYSARVSSETLINKLNIVCQ